MITENSARETQTAVQGPRVKAGILPWIISGAALIVYFVTLNRWVSSTSLMHVAKVSGWSWQPELYQPLYWLVTYPIRWLPPTAIPVALNLFSTVCAVLTLALLVRSVLLLPHDRTLEQRLREKSDFSLLSTRNKWLPPTFAAIVCGLQLTFWEHATAGSNEMLDLLLFAYIIRCVLEYRIDERESWLFRAGLIYGLAIPNNWAMAGFFPLFVVALIWNKGLGFFNLRFLGQMAGCGVLGLLLYLLLPVVQTRAEFVSVPFWTAVKANLGGQKGLLILFLNKNAILHGNKPLWVLALPALIPLLLISIRWPSYFGDTSRLGVGIANAILNLLYGVFLLLCIWVAFDPVTSPRNYRLGLPPLLTFYYLGAICIGYFIGYFLLVFGTKRERARRIPPLLRLLNNTVIGAVWVLFLLAPAVLLYRNVQQIRTTNGPMLKQFTSLVLEKLPAEGAVILSDDPSKTMLFRAATAGTSPSPFILVDTSVLKWPHYHRFLKKLYGEKWPSPPTKEQKPFEDYELINLASYLTKSRPLYYLHPSFGYYFERFYLEPHGLVYKLNSFPSNSLLAPPLSKEVVAENEAFWAHADSVSIEPLVRAIPSTESKTETGLIERFMGALYLDRGPNRDATPLANFLSRALDYWGVEMQKQRELAKAAAYFEKALRLNPDNIVAQVNLDCNKNLQSDSKTPVKLSKTIEDQFGKYRNWDEVMSENGPFDEPNFCYEQGRLHVHFHLYHQAALQFERVKELTPESFSARLWLAQLFVINNMPDEGIRLVNEIHSEAPNLTFHHTNRTELLYVEASAYLAKGDLKGAETVVQSVLEKSPDDEDMFSVATQVYMAYGRFSNALDVIDRQLKLTPDSANVLVNKGYACIQLSAFEQAIPPLTKALGMDTNNFSALLDRAIAYLRSEKFDEAQRDYEALQKPFPTAFQVYFGLGEIAYHKQQTNAAIRNYQLYLTNSPPDNEEAKFVRARLQELTPPH